MTHPHIFMTRTDPYPSQKNVTPPIPLPKFWPVPSPAHKTSLSIFLMKGKINTAGAILPSM